MEEARLGYPGVRLWIEPAPGAAGNGRLVHSVEFASAGLAATQDHKAQVAVHPNISELNHSVPRIPSTGSGKNSLVLPDRPDHRSSAAVQRSHRAAFKPRRARAWLMRRPISRR